VRRTIHIPIVYTHATWLMTSPRAQLGRMHVLVILQLEAIKNRFYS